MGRLRLNLEDRNRSSCIIIYWDLERCDVGIAVVSPYIDTCHPLSFVDFKKPKTSLNSSPPNCSFFHTFLSKFLRSTFPTSLLYP
jgi:hypothetical protein